MRALRSRRGMVGIEAAIILIAFIVTAAALSYVVINMGFFATQKTKEAINKGLGESTSALQLDGVVTAKTNASGVIEYIFFPVKLSVGGSEVDLNNDSIVVSIYLPDAELLDIYAGPSSLDDPKEVSSTLLNDVGADQAKFFIYNDDGDNVLESREKAFLVIHLGSGHGVDDYEKVKIEVKTARGAALTVVRTAPGGMSANSFIDLG